MYGEFSREEEGRTGIGEVQLNVRHAGIEIETEKTFFFSLDKGGDSSFSSGGGRAGSKNARTKNGKGGIQVSSN